MLPSKNTSSPTSKCRSFSRLSAQCFCLYCAALILSRMIDICSDASWTNRGGPRIEGNPGAVQQSGDRHGLPYRSSNGDIPMLVWKLLLYENSTKCRYFSQEPSKSKTHALNMSSNIWMSRSDYPSVCGWYAVLNRSWVPNDFYKLPQKPDVNLGSLSETIDKGTPCSRTTSRIYKSLSLSIR